MGLSNWLRKIFGLKEKNPSSERNDSYLSPKRETLAEQLVKDEVPVRKVTESKPVEPEVPQPSEPTVKPKRTPRKSVKKTTK